MDNKTFEQKWAGVLTGKSGDEFTLFVPPKQKPITQRQFNLYYYYKLINRLIENKGYRNSIEFGCGRGTTSLYFNVYNGFEVTLFDVSDDGVNLARANFDFHGGKGIFFLADSAKVPVPDNRFDVVVSIGLLEHIQNYPDSLKEMYRVLKPGGMLITMNIPQKNSVQVLNDIYRESLMIFKKKIELRKDHFRVADTPDDFKKNAEIVGFKNCRVFYTNPSPLFTPVPPLVEKTLTLIYRVIMVVRSLYKAEPMEGSRYLSQCHFLIGHK